MKKLTFGALCALVCCFAAGCTTPLASTSTESPSPYTSDIDPNTSQSSAAVIESSSQPSAASKTGLYPGLASGEMLDGYYFAAGANSTDYTFVNIGDEFLGLQLLAAEIKYEENGYVTYLGAKWEGETTLTGTLNNEELFDNLPSIPCSFRLDKDSSNQLPVGQNIERDIVSFFPTNTIEEIRAMVGLEEWQNIRCEVTINSYNDIYLEAGVAPSAMITSITVLEIME